MKYKYNHTQVGYLVIYILIFMAILYGFILAQIEFYWSITLFLILIMIIVASFSTLNVRIDNTHIKLKFGYGLFQKRFNVKEITSAKAVKNRWYYGWGIRISLRPYMWIFNVSGYDAVEIKTRNNKTYRIGTDEPKKLERAIMEVIK